MSNSKVLWLVIPMFIWSCGTSIEDDTLDLSDVNVKEYTINTLPYEEMPYVYDYVRSTSMDHFDQDSVPMISYGGTLYYHPVYTSSLGIAFVDGKIRTGRGYYLDLAERIANRLVLNSKEYNDKFLFPYNFNYSYSDNPLPGPWYSGMAQGRLLTLFTRLYNVTDDSKYLAWADSTFESLKLLKSENEEEEWVSYIDEEQYFWIEEYPVPELVHVLNGFIYATFGIYDYYLATEKEEALHLLRASITTIENYIENYRNPGGISFYDLNDRSQKEFYHGVHINQLNLLHKITGEIYFKEMADNFESDHSVSN